MPPWLIVTGDLVRTGGMDQANLALARHLLDRGRAVHLVAHRVDADLLRAGAVLHRVLKPAGSYSLGRPFLDWTGRRWARRVHAARGTVVVNGGNCVADGAVNWVHYVHTAYEPHLSGGLARGLKLRFDRRQALRREALALSRARLVIANSERTRGDLIERGGVAPERVRTIYYGVDPDRFRPATPGEREEWRSALGWAPSQPRLLFVGALGDRRKGFDVVFDALSLLCREGGWDAALSVVGTGQELDAWRARAATAGLERRIEFLGFRSDVDRLIAAADVLVAPTRYEAYGLAVQEALCAGVPAIVSARAGVAERFPPGLRWLLLPDAGTAADLASRLRAWREERERAARQTAELAVELRARTWEHMAREFVDAVERTG